MFIIAILLALLLGFFVGKEYKHKKIKLPELPRKPQLKVLHKQMPKTLDERREQALKTGKPMIKLLYK